MRRSTTHKEKHRRDNPHLYDDDVYETDRPRLSSLLPLLLIPLLVLLGIGGYEMVRDRVDSNDMATNNQRTPTQLGNGMQYGVGGGPGTAVAPTWMAAPSLTPIETGSTYVPSATMQPSVTPSPTPTSVQSGNSAIQGIGGSGSTMMPQQAPSTGMGGSQ